MGIGINKAHKKLYEIANYYEKNYIEFDTKTAEMFTKVEATQLEYTESIDDAINAKEILNITLSFENSKFGKWYEKFIQSNKFKTIDNEVKSLILQIKKHYNKLYHDAKKIKSLQLQGKFTQARRYFESEFMQDSKVVDKIIDKIGTRADYIQNNNEHIENMIQQDGRKYLEIINEDIEIYEKYLKKQAHDIVAEGEYISKIKDLLFILFFIISVIVISTMFYTYNNIIKSIQRLLGFVKSPDTVIAKTKQLQVGNDEMGELTHKFIQLMDKLNISYAKLSKLNEDLEFKVEERTKELLTLNKTLEERVALEVEKNQEKERLLVHQSRLAQLGEMISMIAHQWRQPLATIASSLMNLQLSIELDDYDKDQFSKSLTRIDEHVQHLSKTIDNFRNFFKPDKSKEKIRLSSVFKKSINILKNTFHNNEINLDIDIDDNVVIYTYFHELMHVILNILKNAIDVLIERSIQNKTILIRYEANETEHIIKIADNAGGISQDIIHNIFDPYFSTKLQKNGTGLGLYMSYIIINDHCKGSLEVINQDKGALFMIKLPKYEIVNIL